MEEEALSPPSQGISGYYAVSGWGRKTLSIQEKDRLGVGAESDGQVQAMVHISIRLESSRDVPLSHSSCIARTLILLPGCLKTPPFVVVHAVPFPS